MSAPRADDDGLQSVAERRTGTTVAGAYKLERLIGIGGMGAVYDATAMNGSRVAVKMLHRFVSQLPGARDRFHGEALIARRIQHPGIVRIFDDGVSQDGDLYLVMELLEGESIERRLTDAGGTLPMNEVLPIAMAALDALHAAHEAGVVHRDLKPENLFLTTSRTLKVLDFGIAKMTGPDKSAKRTRTGVVMGTPAFMSPEQAKGTSGDVDRRTDLWAIGAIMYTTLSGRPVHPGEEVGEVLASAAMRPATSFARVVQAPIPLVRVIDRALSFDRHERYADAAEMHAAIADAIAEIRAAAEGTSIAPPAASPEADASLSTLVEADGDKREGDPFAIIEATAEERAILAELFALLEHALLANAQYGVGHPETDKRMNVALSYAVDTLVRTGRPIAWNITPYAFAVGGDVIWEPRTPFDRVPYQLFADGVRIITLAPGLTALELDAFFRLVLKDRLREMAPEDDFVTLLWEADFDHVSPQAIDSFGDGDLTRRSRFESEVRGVEALGRTQPGKITGGWTRTGEGRSPQAHDARVRRLLQGGGVDVAAVVSAEAMLSTANSARPPPKDRSLDLSDDMVRVLAARLRADDAAVEAKFMRSVALAWIEARSSGALEALALRLRGAIDGMAAARPDLALRTLSALCSALAKHPDFGPAVVSVLSVTKLLAFARSVPSEGAVDVRVLLGVLDGSYFDAVLEALLSADEGPIKDLMLEYFARPNVGHEARFGDLVVRADEPTGLAVVRLLVRLGTPEAKTAIAKACGSAHAVVRIEALGHVEGASSERLRLELKALLEHVDAGLRIAALNTIQQNAVRIAGPSLVLRIKSSKFDGLPFDEKRMALETLAVLAPRRAEEVSIELLGNAGLLPTESREQTRTLAAELLGHIAQTDDAREALAAAAGARWRSSDKLRSAAGVAQQRLSRPPGPFAAPSMSPPPPLASFPPARPSWVPPKDKP